MSNKVNIFIDIAEVLNEKLDVIPLLYGSLGLEYISKHNFNADDIDILVPKIFIDTRWEELKSTIESIGFELFDMSEHEFHKADVKIAFADIESLEDYANIVIESIKVLKARNSDFKVLNLYEYLNVYKESIKDGYRKTKNKNDAEKIKIIESLI